VPPATVITRVAVPADAPEMVRTVSLGFQTYRAFAPGGWTPPVSPDGEIVRIRERLSSPGAWALLASAAGEPAGHVALTPDGGSREVAYLEQLFVRPRWWGTGLAATLHEAFLARARADGFRRARLRTPAPHARARRFYERRGWRTDGPADELWDFGIPLVTYRRSIAP
jgi:GNAT superfamily N-acetyltransferase